MFLKRLLIEEIRRVRKIQEAEQCMEIKLPGYIVSNSEPVLYVPDIAHCILILTNRLLPVYMLYKKINVFTILLV